MLASTAAEIMEVDQKMYLEQTTFSPEGFGGPEQVGIVGLYEDFIDILPLAGFDMDTFRIERYGSFRYSDRYIIY